MFSKEFYEDIYHVSRKDKMTSQELYLKTIEETGELNQAVLSYLNVSGCGYKNKTYNDIIEEACDVYTGLFGLLAKNMTFEQFIEYVKDIDIQIEEYIYNVHRSIQMFDFPPKENHDKIILQLVSTTFHIAETIKYIEPTMYKSHTDIKNTVSSAMHELAIFIARITGKILTTKELINKCKHNLDFKIAKWNKNISE